MITAKGVASKKELSRLKAMGFVVSGKTPEGDIFKVTLIRTVSVWPGLIDRLGAEFPGLVFTDSSTEAQAKEGK